MKLQDKVAVVTGAASGMGKQIAIDYAREGAKVVVSDLNLDGANETVEEIKANGGMAFAIKTIMRRRYSTFDRYHGQYVRHGGYFGE
jgi:NAD(P)-dependent dehydrogenase (short-subunit alcohol dehydrogenase family)